MLMRRDAGANRIAFVDVAAPDYSPEANAGISFEAAMERIHAVLPDGTIVTGEGAACVDRRGDLSAFPPKHTLAPCDDSRPLPCLCPRPAADVEVFRRLYEQVGLGWVYAVTKYKPVEALANK